MELKDFLNKVGYEEKVLRDVGRCRDKEEVRELLIEWVCDLDRGFEMGEGEELDRRVGEYLLYLEVEGYLKI